MPSEKGVIDMSDYEILSLVFIVIGIIVTILVAWIKDGRNSKNSKK